MPDSVVNSSHHAIHYIPMTYLLCNWKFVIFVPLQQFFPSFPGASDGKESWLQMQEIWFQSLGQEDVLEKGMAPAAVLLPGEFQGQRGLVGYSPWGHKELDMTE